jgi:hypothetical protein
MTDVSRFVRPFAWIVLAFIAAAQGFAFRHVVSPDGIAYLDLSDAVVHGRLAELVNGYWSPLYPAALGILRLALAATPLSAPYWEFALLHVVSFVGFLASLAAFEWLLRALDAASEHWGDTWRPFRSATGLGFAYLLFAISSLTMISVAGTVPDLLLAAAFVAAMACLIELLIDPSRVRIATSLGLLLGLGALAKAFLFPLSVVVFTTFALVTRARPGARVSLTRAVIAFVVLTSPWIVALSMKSGGLTTGRTGALNYAWYVAGQQPPNTGVMPALAAPAEAMPIEGLAVLHDARGTNPLWLEPERWHSDIRVRFSLPLQWARLSRSVRYYVYVLAPLVLGFAAIGAAMRWSEMALTLRRGAIVLVPCVAALGAYALVYTLSRLVAPFIAAACLVLVAAFPRNATLHRGRFALAISLALVVIHGSAPPTVRSLVVVSYSLVLFMVAWVWFRRSGAVVRWLASMFALGVFWIFPVPTTAVAALVAAGLGAAMWFALRRDPGTGELQTYVHRSFAAGSMIAFAVPSMGFAAAALARLASAPASSVHQDWEVAQNLIRAGVPIGSRIAVLGNPESAGWARIARYRIVGVVPPHRIKEFQALSADDRARIMNAFARAGATRLVTQPR